MTSYDSMNLSEREKDLLEFLILEYINTAQPVSSKNLKKTFKLKISPATIRNVMSNLEDAGLLIQPHISAGRVPTDKAYRFYLNTLMNLQQLTIQEVKRIQLEFKKIKKELDEILETTSQTLTILSGKIGIVLDVHLERVLIDHLEILKVYNKKIVIILVLKTGMVFNETIELPFDISKKDLIKIRTLLNQELTGKDISLAVSILENKMKEIKQTEKDIIEMLKVFQVDFSRICTMAEKLYISNSGNLFNEPDISNVSQLKNVIRHLNETDPLKQILAKLLKSEGISVLIGKEIGIDDLNDFSIIGSPYKINNNKIGVLGVIGPKRMEYSRIISVVDYISNYLSNTLNQIYQE